VYRAAALTDPDWQTTASADNCAAQRLDLASEKCPFSVLRTARKAHAGSGQATCSVRSGKPLAARQPAAGRPALELAAELLAVSVTDSLMSHGGIITSEVAAAGARLGSEGVTGAIRAQRSGLLLGWPPGRVAGRSMPGGGGDVFAAGLVADGLGDDVGDVFVER
jgi:hypothetical protein